MNSELKFSPNFEGLVLGCIEANFFKRGLTSSFDRNFLVILLVLHTSKWVRCHLDATRRVRSR